MSYWGNEFMPKVAECAYPAIEELAKFTGFEEEFLRKTWWRHFAIPAMEDAEGDVDSFIYNICDSLKQFVHYAMERDL